MSVIALALIITLIYIVAISLLMLLMIKWPLGFGIPFIILVVIFVSYLIALDLSGECTQTWWLEC